MIEQLLSRVFAARNAAHRACLLTDSYSQHQALRGFYTGIVAKVDALAEAYQGFAGAIGEFDIEAPEIDDIVAYLRDEADWIEANRELFSGNFAIASRIDAVVLEYLGAIYKMERLK